MHKSRREGGVKVKGKRLDKGKTGRRLKEE